MDTGPIIILANDQKCCYYQSSIQYIARIITTILHHNRDTTDQAAAITVIATKLTYEEYGHEVERSFEFRLINLDSKGEVQVRGQPECCWFILNWDWL
jgi:hypothetical protein